MDDDSFRKGGRVSAVSFSGQSQSTFSKSAQATTAQNGVATFSVQGTSVAGEMKVDVYVDTADNNVTNGYTNKVLLGTIRFNVGSVIDVERLTFTGDFASAVKSGENSAKLGTNESLTVVSGVSTYARAVSVVLRDANGRPAGVGKKVNFYLVEGPTKGYPADGRGDWVHSGILGNPQGSGVIAGSRLFTSIDSAFSIIFV